VCVACWGEPQTPSSNRRNYDLSIGFRAKALRAGKREKKQIENK